MKSKFNKKTSEYEVVIAAPEKKWKDVITTTRKELTDNLEVKGFRKGKVPADVAKKHILEQELLSKAMFKMLDDLSKEAAKSIPQNILVLDGPMYHPMKMNKSELEIKFSYPVYPEINLSEYKNLKIKYVENKVDKSTIDAEMERMLSTKTMLKNKDGNIAKNDVVIFDFEGFVDGKTFEGGKADKFELEIGSGQFIPGFEEQMIGLKKGDKKDLKVTFPKEYPAPNLKGKESTFKVKIHEIKSKIKPELNEEFIKDLNIKDVKTIDDLKKYLKKVFMEQERQNARSKFMRDAFDQIENNTEITVPKTLITKETQQLISKFEEQIKKQGMDLKQYFELTKSDAVKMEAQFHDQAIQRLKDSLVFAEIAKKEKIEIKDADYIAEYKKLAIVYNQSVDKIKSSITKEQMQIPMTNDRVIDIIIDARNK